MTTDPIQDLCLPDAWHDRYELERGRRQSAEHVLRQIAALPAVFVVNADQDANTAVVVAREYLASIGENQ